MQDPHLKNLSALKRTEKLKACYKDDNLNLGLPLWSSILICTFHQIYSILFLLWEISSIMLKSVTRAVKYILYTWYINTFFFITIIW